MDLETRVCHLKYSTVVGIQMNNGPLDNSKQMKLKRNYGLLTQLLFFHFSRWLTKLRPKLVDVVDLDVDAVDVDAVDVVDVVVVVKTTKRKTGRCLDYYYLGGIVLFNGNS